MLFNTIDYFLFLPLVVGLFILLRGQTARLILLLVASYFFYATWNAKYLLLIIFSTLLDYIAAQRIAASRDQRVRTFYLLISITGNLTVLFIFKYYNFFIDNLNILLSHFSIIPLPHLNVLLPVGISFYTFQTLSYTIDVYRGILRPERSLFRFALYVAFFPQLVAGPIERARHLLPQLRSLSLGSEEDVKAGFFRILLGLFKKMVIADTLAGYVTRAYTTPTAYDGFTLLFATILFAFQIYLDFSGYSDIAIGSARIFGIRLMENFRRPYLAKSLQDFWRRWHISLTTWFREYVYFPLRGRHKNLLIHIRNIILIFIISGVWHGAAWTFIIWGALHGVWLSGEVLIKRLARRIHSLKNIRLHVLRPAYALITLTFILLTWVFFRAPSLTIALTILNHILNPALFWQGTLFNITTPPGIAYIFFLLLITISIDIFEEHVMPAETFFLRMSPLKQHAISIILILTILIFGIFSAQPFIYFQF